MRFVTRLKALFGMKADKPQDGFIRDAETGLDIETEDPLMASVIAQAFKTGKPVVGSRDENGKVTIQKLEP